MRIFARGILVVVFLLGLNAGNGWGQSGASVVDGVVADASGAVVPQCAVTLKNTATGVALATQTNNDGVYAFPSV